VVERGLLALVSALGCVASACSLRQDPPPGASGAEIYRLQNCANCHGDRGEGTSRGTALRELGLHWTRDDLADFLADPDVVLTRDARLQAQRRPFSGAMSRYDNLTQDERERLAEYLLGL